MFWALCVFAEQYKYDLACHCVIVCDLPVMEMQWSSPTDTVIHLLLLQQLWTHKLAFNCSVSQRYCISLLIVSLCLSAVTVSVALIDEITAGLRVTKLHYLSLSCSPLLLLYRHFQENLCRIRTHYYKILHM